MLGLVVVAAAVEEVGPAREGGALGLARGLDHGLHALARGVQEDLPCVQRARGALGLPAVLGGQAARAVQRRRKRVLRRPGDGLKRRR